MSKLDAVKGVPVLDAQRSWHVLRVASKPTVRRLLVWLFPYLFAREGANELAADISFTAGSACDAVRSSGTSNAAI